MKKVESKTIRRNLIKNTALAGLGGAMMPMAGFTNPAPPKKGGLIEDKNSKPGTVEWQLQFTGIDVVAESELAQTERLHSGVDYPCPKGNWVFNAGTCWWAEGLSQPQSHIPAGDGGMEKPPYLYNQDHYIRPAPARHNPGGRTFGVNPYGQIITANVINWMIKDSPRYYISII